MIDICECIQKLASDDESDRIYAAEDIGYANQAAGVKPLLVRLAAEPSRAVKEAIFGALFQIEDDVVIEESLALLDSEDPFLRNQAVEVLRARGAKAIPYLDQAFRTGNSDLRKFVIDVIAKVGDTSVSEIYERALLDPDSNIVITAVESIGDSRRVEFRKQIEILTSRHAHPMLLCACIEALAQIGDSDSLNALRAHFGGSAGIPGYLHTSYLKLVGASGCREDVGEVAAMISGDGLEEPALDALTLLRGRYRGLQLPVSLAEPLRHIVCRREPLPLAYQSVRLMGGLLYVDEVFEFVGRCLDNPDKAVRLAAVETLHEAATAEAEAILRDRLTREADEEVLQALSRREVL
jgi:HEAT repeat protein